MHVYMGMFYGVEACRAINNHGDCIENSIQAIEEGAEVEEGGET